MENSTYEEYEKECERIRASNATLLDGFEAHLKKKGLKSDTIKSHLDNVDFYINNYLLYSEPKSAEEGALEIDDFLGDWFIRKATWSSGAHVKANIASFKKFYTFLLGQKLVDAKDLAEMKEMIKEEQKDWIKMADR